MKQQTLFILLLLAISHPAMAQEKKLVMKGNQLYEQKKYKEAQAAYQQALQKKPGYMPGIFNLGNALIQQKQYDAARKVMANAAKNSREVGAQSGAHYNIGNTYLSEQKWSEAVEAYKQALRKNPQDADAKYNLSYALARMKQEQNKDKNKDKNKDNKQDKNKQDQQDKNKPDNKDGNDKKEENKNNGGDKPQDKNEGKDQEDKRPQPQPSKLSQQQADNLLKALQQEERKLQDKKQQEKGVPAKMDKDW